MLTIDSNVLVYAVDCLDPIRQRRSREVIGAAALTRAFLSQQAIGEFCNVALRKKEMSAADISAQIATWSIVFKVVPTRLDQLLTAADLAERRRKQFWDMVLVVVAADAGATTLFSEDIGDGEVVAGVRIVNPFDPANAAAVAALLTPGS